MSPPTRGQILLLDRAASVQFADERALTVRVIGVDEGSTVDGWVWLTVAVLGPDEARRLAPVRTVFVRRAALYRPPDPGLLRVPQRRRVPAAQRVEPVPQLLG